MAYYVRKIRMPFQEVLEKVTENLKSQGFGVITSIDVQDTFNKTLNIKFRNYKILAACNPQFAYKAISMESHLGMMLACNIVVQEHENGEVEVSGINPLDNIDSAFNTTLLKTLAQEVGNKLRVTIDYLEKEVPTVHAEALPA